MIQFVTLDEAKRQLYVLESEAYDDALITAFISAASSAVRNYIQGSQPWQPVLDSNMLPELDSNGDPTYELDSSGDKIVRSEVKQATLLLVGMFYRNREGEAGIINPQWERGYLPASVTALLYPLRTPTLR